MKHSSVSQSSLGKPASHGWQVSGAVLQFHLDVRNSRTYRTAKRQPTVCELREIVAPSKCSRAFPSHLASLFGSVHMQRCNVVQETSLLLTEIRRGRRALFPAPALPMSARLDMSDTARRSGCCEEWRRRREGMHCCRHRISRPQAQVGPWFL